MPRSLHRQLVETSEHEGVSLNAYVTIALARVVGLQTDEFGRVQARCEAPIAVEYVARPDRYAQIAELHESDDQA